MQENQAAVNIIFEDPEITLIFSQLLQAVGVPTNILSDLKKLEQNEKLITEPNFYRRLPPDAQSRCLLVGNAAAIGSGTTCTLTRPLTEEKIERALEQFLAL